MGQVVDVIGAVPYGSGIYLFARIQGPDRQKLVCGRFDLDSQTWDDRLTELELPKDQEQETTSFTAVVEQDDRDEYGRWTLPHLAIRVPSGAIYDGYLNRDGTGWAGEWHPLIDRSRGVSFRDLLAMVQSSTDSFYLLVSGRYFEFVAVGPGWTEKRRTTALMMEPVEGDDGTGGGRDDGPEDGFPPGSPGSILASGPLGYTDLWTGAFSWRSRVYAFRREGTCISYAAFDHHPPGSIGSVEIPTLWKTWDCVVDEHWINQIVVHCGDAAPHDPNAKLLASERPNGRWHSTFKYVPATDSVAEAEIARLAPLNQFGPFNLTSHLNRASSIESLFLANEPAPDSVLAYFEEAYYLIPMHLALQLQASREYTAALDWFRLVHDYSAPADQQKIYYGLKREESLGLPIHGGAKPPLQRGQDWLQDPLNPHAIAATRRNAHTRFTVLSLIRCLTEFADAEFTQDTAESVARARTLYRTALTLLDTDALRQGSSPCDKLLSALDLRVDDQAWIWILAGLKQNLAEIADVATLQRVSEEVQQALAGQGTWDARFARAGGLVAAAQGELSRPRTVADVLAEKAEVVPRLQATLLAQPAMAEVASQLGAAAGRDFLQDVALSTGISVDRLDTEKVDLPWLRLTADGTPGPAAGSMQPATPSVSIVLPPGQQPGGIVSRPPAPPPGGGIHP
jgi:hypothetical protein